MRCLYAIAKADFLQRIRSYPFLITLGVCLVSIFGIIPPAGAKYSGIIFSESRGLNTCGWIGLAASLVFSVYVFMAGFWLINDAVKRDEETGVGQIVATTPVTSFAYLTGKMLSNAAVLFSMLGILALTSLLIFLIRGEGGGFAPGRLLMPMVLILPPGIMLLAGIAVFVETIPRLPRGLINIGWFFLWILVLVISMESMKDRKVATAPTQMVDATGFWTIMNRVDSELEAKNPAFKRGDCNVAFPLTMATETTFHYEGTQPYGQSWIARWICLPVTLLLLSLSSLWFRRFDSTAGGRQGQKEKDSRQMLDLEAVRGPEPNRPPFHALQAPASRFSPALLVKSELRLMLHGRSWLWIAVTTGLFISTIFIPMPIAHGILLPILWFWQIRLYSEIGSRERTYRTHEYLFAAPGPITRQLPACLGAAVLLHLTLAAPLLLRNVALGNGYGVLGILAGAIFLPSLAMALGTWTSGSKFFEVVYTILWYTLLNKVPNADYLGGLATPTGQTIPLVYLGMAVICFLMAIQGRKQTIYSRG